MDLILHLGAHRTGASSFRSFLYSQRPRLAEHRIELWDPKRTRGGILFGLADPPRSAGAARRAAGRVQLNLKAAERRERNMVILSDPNMIGSPRHCLQTRHLYSAVGERMARIHAAFDRPMRIVIQIRALESWWASALSSLVARGEQVPDALRLAAITQSGRSWRHVISDIACACPKAEILVMPFECFCGGPDRVFDLATDGAFAPYDEFPAMWQRRAPEVPELRKRLIERGEDPDLLPDETGRWMPFDATQLAQLREAYADDMFWLRAGADGLARLKDDHELTRTADQPSAAM